MLTRLANVPLFIVPGGGHQGKVWRAALVPMLDWMTPQLAAQAAAANAAAAHAAARGRPGRRRAGRGRPQGAPARTEPREPPCVGRENLAAGQPRSIMTINFGRDNGYHSL